MCTRTVLRREWREFLRGFSRKHSGWLVAIETYDLETGENLWWIGKQGVYPISSPVLFGAMVIAVGIGSDTTQYESFDSLLQQFDANKDAQISREEWSKHPLKDHFGWLDVNNDGFITRDEWDQKKKEAMTEYGVTGNRIAGAGDCTATNVVWRYKKSFLHVITPLIYRDVLYLVTDGGVIVTLNPKTGDVYKTGRTKDAIDEYFASPVGADGKVFLLSHSGKITVLKADPHWEVLSVSDLNETSQATPAIGDRRIYIRTHKALYSFGTMR